MIDKSLERGQTLIEALVALAVAVMVISAISAAVTTSLSNAQYSKNQNIATHYAEEGMEYMRKLRNQDWNQYLANTTFNFLSDGAGGTNVWAVSCLINSSGGPSLDPLTNATGTCGTFDSSNSFIRTVRGEKESTDCGGSSGVDIRKIAVTVAWSDSKCNSGAAGGDNFGIPPLFCHQAQLTSCFSDAFILQGPTQTPIPTQIP